MRRALSGVLFSVVVFAGACGDSDDGSQDATPEPGVTTTSTPAVPASGAENPTTARGAGSTTASTPAMARMFAVDDLTFDSDGVLWATTGDNRSYQTGVPAATPRHLYRLVDDEWQRVEQPTTVFNDPVNWEIRAAKDGGVYVASGWDGPPSPTSGVYYTDGTTWELFGQEFMCGSLAVDAEGELWATCPDFLTRLVDGSWVDIPEGRLAQSVASGPDGSVWFTTFSGPPFELLRFDGTQWATIGPCEDCVGPRSILGIDANGAAWVARGGCGLEGLTRFDPSGDTEDFSIRGARDIAFDTYGSVWLALPCEGASAPAGVAHLANGELQMFTTDDGLPANDVQAVEIGPDGFVYAGTEFGVSRLEPDTNRWVPVGHL